MDNQFVCLFRTGSLEKGFCFSSNKENQDVPFGDKSVDVGFSPPICLVFIFCTKRRITFEIHPLFTNIKGIVLF